MRRILFLFVLLFALSCQTRNTPFPGANLFVDPSGRYHMFFISPPWERAPEDFIRTDVPEDPEREDFAILSRGPLGNQLPEPIPVTGVSIYPPRPLGSIEGAMQGRRNELSQNPSFGAPTDEAEFITNSGLVGREFSFVQTLPQAIIFHREFFFVMPDGFVMRLFYASNRSLALEEVDFITQTLTPGLPGNL